jgi:hypothetical protein
MSPESVRPAADDPDPEYLDDLNSAVKSFETTPYEAQLVIKVITATLVQHQAHGECATCFRTGPAGFGELVPEVVDPEPVQLGVRMEVIKVLSEISDKCIGCIYEDVLRRYTQVTNMQSGEVLLDRGHGYTKVTRGIK